MKLRPDGYREKPAGGARVRADIVDVYVFRKRMGKGIEFLQLLRVGEPLGGTWHPIMGHIEKGETAVECAARELKEEVGLSARSRDVLGFWALEQVHPFYVAAIDCVVLSPRFAVEVRPGWKPRLSDEHAESRWVRASQAAAKFMWPGQRATVEEIVGSLMPAGSLSRDHLRIDA